MDGLTHRPTQNPDHSVPPLETGLNDIDISYDSGSEHDDNLDEDTSNLEVFLSQEKHFFILSTAGKPIYSLHGDDNMIMSYMGVLLTIISFFQGQSHDTDNSDQLRSFTAGNSLFVASYEDPLILVAISKRGESEQQLRNQIDVLYTQILSTLTKSQISRVFKGRTNFDLRRLLGGTEKFLTALTREICKGSPPILLSALECAKLPRTIREKITTILLSHKSPSLLYGLVVSDSRLVSVIRPRKHSLHPPDLLLLFNMIFHTTAFRDGEEHWVPICLPKFNSTGFLYAHIFQFSKNSVLVLISADKDAFFELRTVKDNILKSLRRDNLIKPIELAVNNGFSFRTIDIPVPHIRHFLYKSKLDVQFIMPNIEPHFFPTTSSRKALMGYYHKLHAMVHAKNGGKLKMVYFTKGSATFFGCDSPTFELYFATGPDTTKAILTLSVRAILAWVSKNKERLFIMGGGVF
ncbi:DUF254-domain-containing protein [Nadsonia fulvescens var. elongata DSM 6958]|uniref:Vacuolar fusion protein MON1 n=1 Tax=Nadsonia fulvescens var. elongata DSM 6958 TaxID=857566 RepID=A0A1E3PQZ2_9ASCO|nr:DUF254-domain-containing protein [Nadsonia fulvescens var. elongata DSM 6958]